MTIEEVLIYLTVIALSALKFVAGPLAGLKFGLNIVTTSLLTFSGTMASVTLFTNFNKQIQKLTHWLFKKKRENKKIFSKRNRRFVTIWKKYGMKGVAFLTPILLTPILGTLVANSFSDNKREIIQLMAISALFWAFIITTILFYFGEVLKSIFTF